MNGRKQLTLVAFEYPDADAASVVFERANSTLKNASIWRTATPDLDRWFVIGLVPLEDAETLDWGDGRPFEPAEEQVEWMLTRRISRGAQALADGRTEVHELIRYTPENAPRIPAS